MTIDTSLIGKPIEELTSEELDALSSQLSNLTNEIETCKKEVETRKKALKETAEKEAFRKIAEVAKEQAKVLGWTKLPKLVLSPDPDGREYIVNYVATTRVRGTGKRGRSDVNGGAITINKIATVMGGVSLFRDKDGNEYETLKGVVQALKQPNGSSEAERCWDISRRGISASDIVIRYHADEVTLIFNDGTEKLVRDAVAEMEEARKAVNA